MSDDTNNFIILTPLLAIEITLSASMYMEKKSAFKFVGTLDVDVISS